MEEKKETLDSVELKPIENKVVSITSQTTSAATTTTVSKPEAERTVIKTTAVQPVKSVKKAQAPRKASKTAPKKLKTKKKALAKKPAVKTAKRKVLSAKKEETKMAKTSNTVNFEDYSKQAYQGFEQFSSVGKGFFDAWIQSSNIATTGAQELLKESLTASQQAAEIAMTNAKELMTCRSLNEFTEKQNTYAQDAMNQSMTSATEFTEKYIKLCTEASEPLNKTITSSVEKATKSASKAA